MKKTLLAIVVTLAVLLFGIALSSIIKIPSFQEKPNTLENIEFAKNSKMKIISPSFKESGAIPSKYTCDGQNINPPLEILDPPEGAKSLALIVDDPDAPMGTFTHWIIWNISPEVTRIDENSLPQGSLQGKNDFGEVGYGGPCPPSGTHRYFFKLYALNDKINLEEGASKNDLEEAIRGKIIEQSELVGTYSRKS